MPTDPLPYRCPACGFGIHNRRYPRCERCAVELPASLLYPAEQIARLDAEAEASKAQRAKREQASLVPGTERDDAMLVLLSSASVAVMADSGPCGGGSSCSS